MIASRVFILSVGIITTRIECYLFSMHLPQTPQGASICCWAKAPRGILFSLPSAKADGNRKKSYLEAKSRKNLKFKLSQFVIIQKEIGRFEA
jgi:hypothetical protein